MNTCRTSSISAFVVCCNEEQKLRRCLASVSWCNEIVVIDSGSTDATLEIAKEFTQKIIIRPWPGFVEQKRFGLERCSSDWVLNLDADEEVSSELCAEIQALLKQDALRALNENGFELQRTVFFLGKWWRKGGWHPERRLRLCRRSATTWGGDNPHEKAVVQGTIGRLKGELFHFTYSNIADQVRSLNSLSSAAAETLYAKGTQASLLSLLVRPIARFLKFYFLKKGFLEGPEGLVVAVMESWSVFLKYAKLWELGRRGN